MILIIYISCRTNARADYFPHTSSKSSYTTAKEDNNGMSNAKISSQDNRKLPPSSVPKTEKSGGRSKVGRSKMTPPAAVPVPAPVPASVPAPVQAVVSTQPASLSVNLSEKLKKLIKVPSNSNSSAVVVVVQDGDGSLPPSMLNKLQSLSLNAGSTTSTLEEYKEDVEQVVWCPHCPKSFISGPALESHVAAKHKNSTSSGDVAVGKISGIHLLSFISVPMPTMYVGVVFEKYCDSYYM